MADVSLLSQMLWDGYLANFRRTPSQAWGIEALRARGHVIEVIGGWSHASAPTIVSIDRTTGVKAAAADTRRDRYAFAW